ncbi:trichohyalin isoform X2 [Oryzias latipes]|uniref:trichohyalin isoform X2 n=1 Tax=Oryzias latipes TaxID=8090 RepID=UPI000CE17884|nr:trichohyalin isoform X2 [Oryzias latipes]
MFDSFSKRKVSLSGRFLPTDDHQRLVCEEDEDEWQLFKQGRNASLGQAEPEPSQIKEEPEIMCSKQKRERLVFNQETGVKHYLRKIIKIPVVKLHRLDVRQQRVCEEDEDEKQLHKQESHSRLDQAEPEPPHIIEEPEKREKKCSDQKGEQLVHNQNDPYVKVQFKSKLEETCTVCKHLKLELKELLHQRHHLKNFNRIPVVKLQRIDVQQQHLCEEDEDEKQLHKQESHSRLDQAEPEPPHIKEEPEEREKMCIDHKGEQLVHNQNDPYVKVQFKSQLKETCTVCKHLKLELKELCINQEEESLFLNFETDVKVDLKMELKELLDKHHHLRIFTRIPVVKLQRIDVQQQHLCEKDEDEGQLHKQECHSRLDQAEPEPPHIKEEPEERENMCIDHKGEQLVHNQNDPYVKVQFKSKLEETCTVCKHLKLELKELCINQEEESLFLNHETDVKVDLKLEMKELLDKHHHLRMFTRIPVVKLQRKDVRKQHVCEERNQERNSSLDQTEPEPPKITEEPKEKSFNQEGEQLLLNQEADVNVEMKSDLLDHQQHLRDITRLPVMTLQRKGALDDWLLCNQEGNSRVDQKEPEPPQIREEPVELYSNQEGEQLNLETVVNVEFKSEWEKTFLGGEIKALLDQQYSPGIRTPETKSNKLDFQQLHVCEEDEDEWQKIHSSLDWAEEADVTMENQSECEETFEDVPQQHVCEDDEKWQERHSSLDQAEPEPLQIKEQPEELCKNQEGEQLFLNQGTNVTLENTSEYVEQQQVFEEDEEECQPHKQKRHSSLDQAEPEKLCSNQEGKKLLLNEKEAEVISEYQEIFEHCEIKELLDHQYCLRVRIPETISNKTDVRKQHVCEERNQERNSSLDQTEPEPPKITEEPKEKSFNQEGKQLLLNQEADVNVEMKSDLLDHQQHLRDITRLPVMTLQRKDLSEKHICKENEAKKLLWKEERSSSLVEEEPELPQIKEEEVCIKGEQLELKQKNDSFMVTEDDQEKMEFKPKPRENPVLEANTKIRISDAVTVQMDSPSQENSHSCDALGKDFTQKGHLKTHTSIHITDMPYSCKVCQKCYTQSSELKVHMRTHTGERPFTCKICERGFVTNGSLKLHLTTHTG